MSLVGISVFVKNRCHLKHRVVRNASTPRVHPISFLEGAQGREEQLLAPAVSGDAGDQGQDGVQDDGLGGGQRGHDSRAAGGGSQKGDTADRRAVREGPGPCRLQH